MGKKVRLVTLNLRITYVRLCLGLISCWENAFWSAGLWESFKKFTLFSAVCAPDATSSSLPYIFHTSCLTPCAAIWLACSQNHSPNHSKINNFWTCCIPLTADITSNYCSRSQIHFKIHREEMYSYDCTYTNENQILLQIKKIKSMKDWSPSAHWAHNHHPQHFKLQMGKAYIYIFFKYYFYIDWLQLKKPGILIYQLTWVSCIWECLY